jgi:hypothetical protein
VLNPTRRADTAWLAAIVALGAMLRLYPVWFGLPYLNARPDETVALGHAVAVMRGDINPHFFHWPSLTFYLFAAVFTAISDVYGAVIPGGALSDAGYFIVARIVVALAGTATIAVLFQLGRRMANAWTGLAAAAFLAVAILHVRESHFAMTDALMTLLVTGSLALLVRALDDTAGSPAGSRWFAAAGLVGGLAASTKYSAAAVIAAMAAVQLSWFVRSPRRAAGLNAWAPSVTFIAAFVCGFLVATPYAILDSPAFATDLRFDFTHLSAGHAVNVGRGWLYHLMYSLPFGGPALRVEGPRRCRVCLCVLCIRRQRADGVLSLRPAACAGRLSLCGGCSQAGCGLGRVQNKAARTCRDDDAGWSPGGMAARELRAIRHASRENRQPGDGGGVAPGARQAG